MAHHSELNSELLNKLMSNAVQKMELGATGQFPEGKLTPEDEGEIRIAITSINGKVVIDFGKPIAWIGFTREQAKQIAETLLEKANQP